MKKHIIGVHVGQPQLLPIMGFPQGNWIGAILLHRLLSLALSKAGLLAAEAGAAGEFNDCIALFAVTNAAEAVAAVKDELQTVELLFCCQIGVFNDGKWECIYPSSELRLSWLLDAERQELRTAQYVASVAEEKNTIVELQRIVMLAVEARMKAVADSGAQEADQATSGPAGPQ